MKSISEELLKRLKELAVRKTLDTEVDNAYEASGGNFDDAYTMGVEDGETYLAQEILDELSDED